MTLSTTSRAELAEFAAQHRADFERWLARLVNLPSVSVDPAHAADVRRCAEAAESIPEATGRVDVKREIRVASVCFRYDANAGAPTLESVDFVIPAAKTLAIVGRTGAGKSTLADLLLGLVTPNAGFITIDGVPLTGAMLGPWRRSVGYVPQDNFLFNDTVRANLLWAFPEAREEDIRRALSIAAAIEVYYSYL